METTSLTFAHPQWLWALAALPVFAALQFAAHQRGLRLLTKVVAPRLRQQLAGSVSIARRVVRSTLVLSALGLLFIALAQPRMGFVEQESKAKGRDVVIAIDTSRSMLATDVAPDRLSRAKLLTQDLLRLLRGDRVGLVAFAGSSFLQAPLTLDYSAVINSLDELDTNVIPKGGTNIAAAIATAEEAFGKAEGTTRALIILTDGEELDADGLAAAKRAKEAGIRIFTVGIGSPEGSLIPFRTEDGRQDFVRDQAGKPVQSRLDESRLREIAESTGGFYVPLGTDAAREIFSKGIEPLDRVETGAFSSRQPVEKYQWPLGAAIALLIIWLLIGERRQVRAIRTAAAAVLSLLVFSSTAGASTGVDDYKAGDFEKARADFESRLKLDPDSHKLQFNAGAAAYKQGDFEQAIAHFTNALLSEDKALRTDAAYNLANSLVRRGEAAKETEAKKADWTNAVEQYTEALNLTPSNKPAEENREIVKKLLEELEKQQQQQDQKKDDQQKKDDKKDQQQNKDQQNKDDQKKDQQDQKDQDQKDQQQDQQNKDQQDQKSGDQKKDDQQGEGQNDPKDSKDGQDKKDEKGDKPEEQKDSGNKQQQDKNDAGKKNEPAPAPSPTPGDKKEGELKSTNPEGQNPQEQPREGQQAAGATGEEEEKDGEMSAAQARGLLNSLRSEEEKVNLLQQQTTQDVLRDW